MLLNIDIINLYNNFIAILIILIYKIAKKKKINQLCIHAHRESLNTHGQLKNNELLIKKKTKMFK